jgi:hypothetical protein
MSRYPSPRALLASSLRLLSLAAGAAVLAAGGPAGAEEAPIMNFQPGVAKDPNFQPYVFWAYGAVCLFLALFTLWTLVQVKRVEAKIDYLEGRLRRGEGNQGRTPPG